MRLQRLRSLLMQLSLSWLYSVRLSSLAMEMTVPTPGSPLSGPRRLAALPFLWPRHLLSHAPRQTTRDLAMADPRVEVLLLLPTSWMISSHPATLPVRASRPFLPPTSPTAKAARHQLSSQGDGLTLKVTAICSRELVELTARKKECTIWGLPKKDLSVGRY